PSETGAGGLAGERNRCLRCVRVKDGPPGRGRDSTLEKSGADKNMAPEPWRGRHRSRRPELSGVDPVVRHLEVLQLIGAAQPDISTLLETGHFYLGLTC